MLTSTRYETLPKQSAEDRRSDRIPLYVRLMIAGTHPQSGAHFRAAGKTLVVNRQGALIATVPGLSSGTLIYITIPATGKSARARVVWDEAAAEGRYGIELETQGDLWGIVFPPQVGLAGPAPEPHLRKA